MHLLNKLEIPGLFFSVFLGLFFYFLAPYLHLFNAVILGLLGGIVIGNFVKIPVKLDEGIKYTGTKFLEFSILFLAFDISFANIKHVGWMSFVVVILVLVFVLSVTFFLSKKISCPGSAGYLVGFGTAICGSSAIAAISPVISKNKEDVGVSLAVVNLIGTLGMLFLPLLLPLFDFTTIQNGLMIGSSLHSVGNVAGAGFGMGEEIGKTAITIKLARVALLPLAVVVYSFLLKSGEHLTWKQHLKLPYYLWGFIVISLLVSFFNVPETLVKTMKNTGNIVLTIAMTAIGFRVGFKNLFYSGQKALMFGSLIFLLQLLLLFTLVYFLV